ncbi:FAD:protein FMN transferase [Prosthecobacter fusiformis]|nr:FAD:protein FMN transferase [Prosthecobacter fusiformis]
MGTTWSLQIADPVSGATSSEIEALIRDELHSLEKEISHWDEKSDLSRWNRNTSTEWQTVPASVAETVDLARRIAEETGGALDVTIAPLVALWGFSRTQHSAQVPADKEIREALSQTGWDKLAIEIQPPSLKKTQSGVQINVASVAEGYAMDALLTMLKAQGLKNFLLEIGGEVAAAGYSREGGPWQVGIQAPDGARGEPLETIPLTNTCIATSGSYRHRFEKDGRTYSHLLDPHTGRPIEHKLVSVSVIHPSCALADGYATALMVLGPVKGRQVAERLGLRVIWLEEP